MSAMLIRMLHEMLYISGDSQTVYLFYTNMFIIMNDVLYLLVQAFDPMADCAQKIMRDNKLADKIRLIPKRSTSIIVAPGKQLRAACVCYCTCVHCACV